MGSGEDSGVYMANNDPINIWLMVIDFVSEYEYVMKQRLLLLAGKWRENDTIMKYL